MLFTERHRGFVKREQNLLLIFGEERSDLSLLVLSVFDLL